jgi:hypothetical protein
MIERGQLPTRRLGRRVVILPDELAAYLKSLPAGARQRRDRADGAGGAFLTPTRRRPRG